MAPAFADVGAARFFAHGCDAKLFEVRVGFNGLARFAGFGFEPFGQARLAIDGFAVNGLGLDERFERNELHEKSLQRDQSTLAATFDANAEIDDIELVGIDAARSIRIDNIVGRFVDAQTGIGLVARRANVQFKITRAGSGAK